MAFKIVLASSNKGKAKEIKQHLGDLPIEIVTQDELGIKSVAETGATFVENAIIKARHAAIESGLPAIADDSGLVVDALAGAPGVNTARIAGDKATDQDRINALLKMLEGVEHRQADFYCVIALMANHLDPAPVICQGMWEGEILTTPQGKQGFGFDPVFYVMDQGCSAAELDLAVKNEISHRGQALQQLKSVLAQYCEAE